MINYVNKLLTCTIFNLTNEKHLNIKRTKGSEGGEVITQLNDVLSNNKERSLYHFPLGRSQIDMTKMISKRKLRRLKEFKESLPSEEEGFAFAIGVFAG